MDLYSTVPELRASSRWVVTNRDREPGIYAAALYLHCKRESRRLDRRFRVAVMSGTAVALATWLLLGGSIFGGVLPPAGGAPVSERTGAAVFSQSAVNSDGHPTASVTREPQNSAGAVGTYEDRP